MNEHNADNCANIIKKHYIKANIYTNFQPIKANIYADFQPITTDIQMPTISEKTIISQQGEELSTHNDFSISTSQKMYDFGSSNIIKVGV